MARKGSGIPQRMQFEYRSSYHPYCLIAIVQHDMHLNRSTYEVLQILSISLTDKYLYNIYSIRLISMKSKSNLIPFVRDGLINY